MQLQILVPLLVTGTFGLAVVATLCSLFFTVEQHTTAIVQRLGEYLRAAGPGLRIKIPFIDRVAGRVDLRVQEQIVEIGTKTKDSVFVRVAVAVQYHVLPDRVYDAFYKLDDVNQKIASFVTDLVRAQVPRIQLADAFTSKDEIAHTVKGELCRVMGEFGYGITQALVRDIEPDPTRAG